MEIITAEQAAEAAKGLTFEKVWAALMEGRLQMENAKKESDKQFQELQKQFQEQMKESQKKTDKIIADLSKNIGGLGNSLGRLTETIYSMELWKKFNELGYPFTKQGPHVKFIENRKVLAEADFLLENGEYVMVVEVKTELSVDDINEHLQRIADIRRYCDTRGDTRKLVGCVAGGIIQENVLKYALKKGLYVATQTGETVAIADLPQDFKAREW